MLNWIERDNVWPYFALLGRVVLTILALLMAAWLLPVFFSFFLPFVLAFGVAMALNPLILLLQKKIKFSRNILSVLMVVIALLVVAGILGGFIYALAREVVSLAQNIDAILEYFGQTITILSIHLYWMLDFMPADAEEIIAGIVDTFMVWLQNQGTAFADTVITQTASVAARVGGGVVSIVIFIMASYFMMADYPRFVMRLRNAIGPRAYQGYNALKDATFNALGSYLRAQVLMAFITFAFVLIALLIIGQEYAVLLAFIMGILDFLPLVGTSIILVPWGIVNLIGGEIGRALYLFGMSSIAFLLRRIIEPKVVGSQMGLSPLTALLSIYIGMQLGGVIGLILGPVVAMVFVSLYKAGIFNGWQRDIKAVLDLRKRS